MTEASLIHFFKEDVQFKLFHQSSLRQWVNTCITMHKKTCGEINFIFCSDRYLLNLNKTYLKHHTLTDIITFDYTIKKTLSGDIFISIERVAENAITLKTNLKDELHRVIIHGVLHLCGFSDKTPFQKKRMRKAEDKCLSLRTF
jgi:rRNA maturation RNase YbeY